MIVYLEDKNTIVENPDLEKGWLKEDIIVHHEEAIEGVEEEWHYETVKEADDGSKIVKRVTTVPGVEARPAYDWNEHIQVYIPFTEEELEEKLLSELRERREVECFAICDRAVWYDSLIDEQKEEVKVWRQNWLDVTVTKVVPDIPSFI